MTTQARLAIKRGWWVRVWVRVRVSVRVRVRVNNGLGWVKVRARVNVPTAK